MKKYFLAIFALSVPSMSFVSAQNTKVSITDLSLTQMLVLGFNAVWAWILVPTIVIFWFYTGFLYVTSEGQPEGIKKAHTSLKWTVVVTVILAIIQGIIFAATDTLVPLLK